MSIEATALSHTGMLREHNEDSYLADTRLGLYMVADGMGGHLAGEVASKLGVDTIRERLEELLGPEEGGGDVLERAARDAINLAHRQIRMAAQHNPAQAKMGTTVALLLVRDANAVIAHVGDSRIYRLRDALLQPLTRDHSLLQEQVAAGYVTSEEARLSHNRNLITQALGVEEQVTAEVTRIGLRPGDIYLLCSDGLNTMVGDRDIELLLTELSGNLPLAARVLVQVANDNGGHDNVTLVLARVPRHEQPAQAPRRGLLARWFGWLSGK